MAVVSVNLYSTSQESSPGKRIGEKIYKVIVDSSADDAGVARVATDGVTTVPARGDEWSVTDTTLRCTGVSADLEAPPDYRVYLCRARFETGDVADEIENPLDELAIVEWSELVSVEPVYVDNTGAAITNSAEVTFDPPVQDDIYDLQFTVTRNLLTRDPAVLQAYLGAVNVSSFGIRSRNGILRTVLAGKAKLVGWRVVDADRNGFNYQQETITVACRRDGWTRNLLDHGYTTINVTDEQEVIVDANDLPLNQPVNLDGAGAALPFGDPPVFLAFDLEPTEDFNDLDFPT